MTKKLPAMTWNDGPPPRRGVWPVRSAPPAQPNRGWRYWDGERWGVLTSSRQYCLMIKGSARQSRVCAPIQWGKPAVTPPPRFSLQWQPLTPALLDTISRGTWGETYWLAIRGHSTPEIGSYEWRQGQNPDGFDVTGFGRIFAKEVTHVMPFNPPSMPDQPKKPM